MNSVRIGRTLGIGARIAGKALSKALEPAAAPNASGSAGPSARGTGADGTGGGGGAARAAGGGALNGQDAKAHAMARPNDHTNVRARAPEYRAKGKAIAHGTKRFGEAVWGPFAHAGRTLWLEVVGVFFGVFALFFGQQTWVRRAQYAHGPEHQHFLAFAIVFVMFVYLSASSFVRSARRPGRR